MYICMSLCTYVVNGQRSYEPFIIVIIVIIIIVLFFFLFLLLD